MFYVNGNYLFDFTNAVGASSILGDKTVMATVDWIDMTPPVCQVNYSYTGYTNQDVIASVGQCSKAIIMSGSDFYTFTGNGNYTFNFTDHNGIPGSATAIVNWIDKSPVTGTIVYTPPTLTAGEVIAAISFNKSNVTILNNNGNNMYIFENNGIFTFRFVDRYGNEGQMQASVNWISNSRPYVTNLVYDPSTVTNTPVNVTLQINEAIQGAPSGWELDGTRTILTKEFPNNDSELLVFYNDLGLSGTAEIIIDWIDNEPPVCDVLYSTTSPTSQNVISSLTNCNKTIVMTTGSSIYTFMENGEHMFYFADRAGNTGSVEAKVTWIDKEPLIAYMNYSPSTFTPYSVTATISFNKSGVTITNRSGNEYVFDDNGAFLFRYHDELGNVGSINAYVNWIDKNIPYVVQTIYEPETSTNTGVLVKLIISKEIQPITGRSLDVTETILTKFYTENTTEYLDIYDLLGNQGKALIDIDWISVAPPTCEVGYSTTSPTNQSVTAILENCNKPITMSPGQSTTYLFANNGSYIFYFSDSYGNTGSATATVNWIDKSPITGTIVYSTTGLTNQDVTATISFNKTGVTILNNS